MFIVRVQSGVTRQEIRTFTFESEQDMDKAVAVLKKTTCKGFSAIVSAVDALKGRIMDQWDHSSRFTSSLSHMVQYGAYRDTISEVFGHEDECSQAADETNKAATCWASRTATLSHVAGDLFKVTFVSPFTD